MKVWILTNAYIPEKGGLVSYAKNIAKAILTTGDEVEIITSNLKKKELLPVEIIDGVKVSRIDYSGIPKLLKLFAPIIYYKRNKKFLKNIQFGKDDIVISRFYSFAAAIGSLNKNVKHIFITPLVAAKLQKIEAKKVKNIFKKIYSYLVIPQISILDKMAIRKSTIVGVLSKSKKEEVEKAYHIESKKIDVFYPGIDEKRFMVASKEEKIQLREKLGFKEQEKILLCVARLEAEKNQEIVIDCMEELKEKKYSLYFVGDGDNRQLLQQKIEEKKLQSQVKLLGEKTNVEDYYRASDVFILPSKYEGFGHVYLEALACGLPCIAAKSNPPETITASSEIITSDKLGRVVAYNNKTEMVEAIQFCMDTSEKYSNDRNEYVTQNFNWKNHYLQIKGVLSSGE